MQEERSTSPLPWHPLLFALFPILFLGGVNGQEISPADLVRPAAATLALTAILWLAGWGAQRRDARRSALLASALVFWIFSYGLVDYAVRPGSEGDLSFFFPIIDKFDAAWATPLLWTSCLLLSTGAALRLRTEKIGPATRLLNTTALALVALPLASLVFHPPAWFTAGIEASRTGPSTDPTRLLPGQPPTPSKPDIYFIVNDAYARQDVLQRYFGFDNGPFVRALERRGFFVARNSHANYDMTPLALAAALGMDYLDDLARMHPHPSFQACRQRIDRSAVAAYLRSQGYNYIAIESDFDTTRADSADLLLTEPQSLSPHRITPFESLLIGTTPLRLIPPVSTPFFDAHRGIVNAVWTNLSRVARLQRNRKFVLVHVLAPHPPFVFGPNGEHVTPSERAIAMEDGSYYLRAGGTKGEYLRGYPAQLQYVNRRTLEVIDAIRARSPAPPIILLIGDHGSRLHFDFDRLARTDVAEYSGNLSAFLLPDGSAHRVFGDDITPVNIFRLLFDHQFGAALPRLPDRTYYSTVADPFTFTDVTAFTLQRDSSDRNAPLYPPPPRPQQIPGL